MSPSKAKTPPEERKQVGEDPTSSKKRQRREKVTAGSRASEQREAQPAAELSGAPAGLLVWLWDQFGTLALAVLIALAIRAFVIEPFRIPSGSMLPTLLIGDHLFVNKFVYGPRIPFTDYRLPGLRKPQRGDVVVFQVSRGSPDRIGGGGIFPADERPDLPRDDFVKRIVGLPGDHIQVRSGRVYVNGQIVDLIATDRQFVDEDGRRLDVLSERLDGCEHAVLDDRAGQGLFFSDAVVPEGRYFMMGDNRDHSNDSRAWGTVRLEEIQGPAFILYWSWNVKGNVLQFLNPVNWWSAEKRWDRIFRRVKCGPVQGAIAGAGADDTATAPTGALARSAMMLAEHPDFR
jgi:signal peptidase I